MLVNIQRLEFIVVNLIYVLYSMVLRASGHELHVQLCNSFHVWVSVVLLSAYLHARMRVSEGEFLLVHRTRDHTVISHRMALLIHDSP